MSWLSSIGNVLGKVASNPIVDAGLSFIPGVGPGIAAAVGAGGRALEGITGGNGQPQQGGGGILGQAGSWLTGNGGKNALGVLQGLNAAQLQNQATQYAKGAYGNVTNSYNQRAPLRAAGISGMLQPRIPDMSGVASIASNNPYAAKPTGASPPSLVPIQGAPQ